jgi:alanine racemase|tara:strand:- start:1032 stop:1205 length:174 start_codon:yes stop_codon:yes gene_type:complete
MDQTVVEVDDRVAVGDEAVILGGQGDGFLAVGEMADATGTIGYEVLATVGSRVPRRY